jgi:hypothetical protein
MKFTFDPATAPVSTAPEYGPLPAGKYEMIITATDIKTTKAGTGEYLEAVMEVVSGPKAGRKHWERFNISNPNKQAEDIARAALGSLCAAVNVSELTDTDQLHDRLFIAVMAIDKKDAARNRIMGYEGVAAAQPSRAAQPTQRAGGSSRPWAQ